MMPRLLFYEIQSELWIRNRVYLLWKKNRFKCCNSIGTTPIWPLLTAQMLQIILHPHTIKKKNGNTELHKAVSSLLYAFQSKWNELINLLCFSILYYNININFVVDNMADLWSIQLAYLKNLKNWIFLAFYHLFLKTKMFVLPWSVLDFLAFLRIT